MRMGSSLGADGRPRSTGRADVIGAVARRPVPAALEEGQSLATTAPAITAYPVSLAWMSPSWHIQVQAQMVATLVGTAPPSAGTFTGAVTVLRKAVDTSATSAPTVAAEAAMMPLRAAWRATDCCARAWPAAPVR